jgi:hypothetical protein
LASKYDDASFVPARVRCIYVNEDEFFAYLEFPLGLGGEVALTDIRADISTLRNCEKNWIDISIRKQAYIDLIAAY